MKQADAYDLPITRSCYAVRAYTTNAAVRLQPVSSLTAGGKATTYSTTECLRLLGQ